MNDQGNVIKAIVQVFQNMGAFHQTKSKELFHGKEAVITYGFVMICNKCNMDPMPFSMSEIDSVPWLGVHYNAMQIVKCIDINSFTSFGFQR
jgi:hypothetical protein